MDHTGKGPPGQSCAGPDPSEVMNLRSWTDPRGLEDYARIAVQNRTSPRGSCIAAVSRPGWRNDWRRPPVDRAAAASAAEQSHLNCRDRACSCYYGGWGLTRDVGVLQACRHLPLVHL